MKKLLEKVEKELENIAEKGLTSSNLETTYKLIDIYKDIYEQKYYESQTKEGSYDARMRDSRGRYMNGYEMNYNHGGEWEASGRYNNGYNNYNGNYNNNGSNYNNRYLGPMERYFTRMEDGMESYNVGRDRYRNGDSQDRLVEGMEMIMSAVCMFVEELSDYAETPQEKEVIRKHLSKMKKI